MRRLGIALALAFIALPAAAQTAKGAKVTWLTKYADALAAAKKDGRPIAIDAGREA